MELTKEHIPTREEIDKLQREMSVMPQAELQTEHYFSGGMYCRKLTRPAGTLIVGKVHKKDHFFLCAKGEIIAWSEGGMRHLYPGDVICSKPGTKEKMKVQIEEKAIWELVMQLQEKYPNACYWRTAKQRQSLKNKRNK